MFLSTKLCDFSFSWIKKIPGLALKQVKEHGSLFDFNTGFGDRFQYYKFSNKLCNNKELT